MKVDALNFNQLNQYFNMEKFNLQVNTFPGFYESYLLNSDDVYYESNTKADEYKEDYPTLEFSGDDFELDTKAYEHDVCVSYIDALRYDVPSFVKSIEMDELNSPSQYNYRTDQLYVNVELDDNWLDVMKQFIADNNEWFTAQIEKDWRSRSGFMSFMDSDVTGWIENLEKKDERYISVMLTYMLMKEQNATKDDLSYNYSMCALEDIYLYCYLVMTKEKQELVDEEKKRLIR